MQRSGERKINQMVQMSARLMENDYDAFRAVCEEERRTNSDMLAIMTKVYLEWRKEKANKR